MSVITIPKWLLPPLWAALILATLTAFGLAAGLGWEPASRENGVIENAQIALLAVSLVCSLLAAFWSSHLLRVAMCCWAAVMLLMIQREFDFAILDPDGWLYMLRTDAFRIAFWLPLVTGLAVWAFAYRRFVARTVKALRLRHLWPILTLAMLILASEVTEWLISAGFAKGRTYMFVFAEELFELNGYLVITALALAIALQLRMPGTAEEIAARHRLDPAF